MTDQSTIPAALRGLVSSETRIALVLATLLIGAGAAFALAFILPADVRTFARVVPLTQLSISVLTPFATALLTHDLRTSNASLRSRWLAAGIYGLLAGVLGAAASAAAVAVGSGGQLGTVDPWAGAWSAALGSLVVQLIPVGVGCAAGLLIRRARNAELATIAVPLAASFLLGRYAPDGATDWLTPLAAASHLLPGPMTPLTWAQWVVTAALWVVLPNADRAPGCCAGDGSPPQPRVNRARQSLGLASTPASLRCAGGDRARARRSAGRRRRRTSGRRSRRGSSRCRTAGRRSGPSRRRCRRAAARRRRTRRAGSRTSPAPPPADSPITANTRSWMSRRWIRIEPPPISLPLQTRSYA